MKRAHVQTLQEAATRSYRQLLCGAVCSTTQHCAASAARTAASESIFSFALKKQFGGRVAARFLRFAFNASDDPRNMGVFRVFLTCSSLKLAANRKRLAAEVRAQAHSMRMRLSPGKNCGLQLYNNFTLLSTSIHRIVYGYVAFSSQTHAPTTLAAMRATWHQAHHRAGWWRR